MSGTVAHFARFFGHTQTDPIILVTGATGWLGRSVLHELQRLIPANCFNEHVYAFGSKHGVIQSTAYKDGDKISVPVYSLQDISSIAKGRDIRVVHMAFLTKDRLSSYGYSSFVDTNRWITDTVCHAISLAKDSRIVDISSGAAALTEERRESTVHTSVDPYGFMKLREERLLSDLSLTQVFRIYALTGRFIRDPEKFAIGDFLLSALKSTPIHIKASGPVIRGYVAASDVAQVALYWLMSQEDSCLPISAVTHTVTLATLASSITTMFNLPPVTLRNFADLPSTYSHSPSSFLDMMQSFGLRPMTLGDQILETARGLGST